MNSNTKKIVITAMLASLCCVATMIIKVPSPFQGYLNLGDCIVLISGWLLTPKYAFFAAGIGSALADLFSGYTVYVPATFLIKGTMAIAAHFIFNKYKVNKNHAHIISALCAELIMIIGYYTFEGCLYGFVPSLVNMPANIAQGALGLIIAINLIKVFDNSKIF